MTPPILNGYTIEWDPQAGEWVARHDKYGTVLRGKDQRALDAALGAHVMGLVEELRQILAGGTWHGYPPPP